VRDRINSLGDFVAADIVLGAYDLIVQIKTDSLSDLEKVISEILKIDGVLGSTTMICAP
jgi:DNA-binding Lrp family transcriptional regulator